LVTALATLGLAFGYVALRFAYTRFYDALGVAPEDLGLGKVDLLVRSAGLVVVFAMVGALVLEVAAIAVALLVTSGLLPKAWQVLDWVYEDRPGGALVGLGVLLWLVAAVVGWTGQLRKAAAPTGYVSYAMILTGVVLVYGRRRGFRHLASDVRETGQTIRRALATAIKRVARRWKAGAAAVIVLSVAVVFVVATLLAPVAARLVEQGKAYHDWTVPWRADPATVRWLHQPQAGDPLSGPCVMYLGQANGIVVLYDVRSRRVVRVPSGDVVVLIETSADSCQRHT
jgi:hypothetical protein